MPTNEDIQKTLNDFMNGFKPLRRSNPKTGQSEWYYMAPKNPSDEFTEYDYIDVPSPNTPNPLNSLNKMSKKNKRFIQHLSKWWIKCCWFKICNTFRTKSIRGKK